SIASPSSAPNVVVNPTRPVEPSLTASEMTAAPSSRTTANDAPRGNNGTHTPIAPCAAASSAALGTTSTVIAHAPPRMGGMMDDSPAAGCRASVRVSENSGAPPKGVRETTGSRTAYCAPSLLPQTVQIRAPSRDGAAGCHAPDVDGPPAPFDPSVCCILLPHSARDRRDDRAMSATSANR